MEKEILREYATRYETPEFIIGDPSWFMHQVQGTDNQEAMAFVASGLSYGSRPVFMKKIQALLDDADGEMYEWIREGAFRRLFSKDDDQCFYRFYTNATMHDFLQTYRSIILEYGNLGTAVCDKADNGYKAVERICQLFNATGKSNVIPQSCSSACKRVCMFLRWMVRDNSPVDIGLWAGNIDKRTLIIPLDTHVLQQSNRLGLINSKSASMATARSLTRVLSEVFPDDPLRGDFALFGYGVNNK